MLRPVLLLCALIPVADALAQRGRTSAPPPRPGNATTEAPPAGVPGAAASGRAAPRGDRELPPTEALFDAINRGDIADVRAALARGGRTDARNALGATPVEQAVDLGRSDIALLLLSLRGGTAVQGPPDQRPNDLRRPPGVRAPARPPAAVAPAQPVRARLWANDGGTPMPEIGFLGFDASRTAAAPAGVRRR